MNTQEILCFEIEQFKEGVKKSIDFSKLDKSNVKKALSKALNDTLAMAAIRFNTPYKTIENALLGSFINDYFVFASKEIAGISSSQFNAIFNRLIHKFKKKMEKLKADKFATHGFAQKFVSMSFKYMYCFDGAIKDNFAYCKLPLDKYTIKWYRKQKDAKHLEEF